MIAARLREGKGQHEVGLAIKEIVKKAGEDGITIECISARPLKAQISIKSNFVTFVVAYDPTEEVPERQTEGQIHGNPQLHRSISARSGIRLRFNRRKHQDRDER